MKIDISSENSEKFIKKIEILPKTNSLEDFEKICMFNPYFNRLYILEYNQADSTTVVYYCFRTGKWVDLPTIYKKAYAMFFDKMNEYIYVLV